MIKLAQEFNEKLKKEGCVSEYLQLKSVLESDQNIQSLIEKIKNTQHELKGLVNDRKAYLSKAHELEDLKQQLYSIPEVINYMQIKEEVADLIAFLTKIIGD